jgi:ABC-type protease/lipase transport system fused ATPase/permease subunit
MSAKQCWSCHADLDGADRYCRFCGKGQGEFVSWYYKPFWIVILTLTVLGPFSLYLIWKSPVLSRKEKWLLVLLVFVVSYYLVVGTMELVRQAQMFLEFGMVN